MLPAAGARGATIEKGWMGGMSQVVEGGEGSRKYKPISSALCWLFHSVTHLLLSGCSIVERCCDCFLQIFFIQSITKKILVDIHITIKSCGKYRFNRVNAASIQCNIVVVLFVGL